ncbi:hypothetical protein BD289DRAFT_370386 [Coniella lustricola]|uniref:Uncharacterized protein n=1 Tax=Coniella lustricola TaxID=2025994 RepID=A0A2T3A585_9PEZI|nr:hypothetical protein BD289DRAFT_370386 [Coniella lustricola]
MSQTGSAGVVTPRRNPRRGGALHQDGPSTRQPAPSPTPRVTRSATRRLHYITDASSDDALDFSDEDSLSDDARDGLFRKPRQTPSVPTVASTRERRSQPGPPTAQGGRRRAQRPGQPSQGPTTPTPKKRRPFKFGYIGRARKTALDHTPQPAWPTSGVIPPWQSLEWTILVQIFEYAAYPANTRSNVRWLLAAGLTCKAFLGPAMKALYRCPMPQIISMNMGVKFASLMRDLAANRAAALACGDHRRTMVESLVIEASSLPNSQSRNFDVAELIMSLPHLNHVELYHELDLPPYRQLDLKAKKWIFPKAVLDALRDAGRGDTALRLKSWKWSQRMMQQDLLHQLPTIHGWDTFSQLRKLCFVNFQVPSLGDSRDPSEPEVYEQDKNYINLIASSLEPVVSLRHLVMESSTIVDGQFLSLLPKTLEHLEIVNCWEVTAEMLSEYLMTHGRTLRRLTLNHNQSLNLSFLPYLGECCPMLQELSMDLLTFNHHEYYKDSDPLYDKLLTVADVPNWPETLEIINLEQLAKWDADTAEMFFQSLIDQAPKLLRLRYLAVKAMLDVPWRQRSQFRDKWVRKLKKVFLRKAQKPRNYHSLIQWPFDRVQPEEESVQLSNNAAYEGPSARRSTRAPKDNKRKRIHTRVARDLRKPKRARISYRDPDTDEELGFGDDSDDNDHDELQQESVSSPLSSCPVTPVSSDDESAFEHGLCDVVNIRFDNQKPREFQWGAEDFLDDDMQESDDAEWTSERNVDDDSDTYAW